MSGNNPISERPKTKLKQKLVDSQAPKFAFIQRVSNKFVLRFFFDRCPELRGQGFSAQI